MCRGDPVGYLLFRQTGAEGVKTMVIGDANKQKAPSFLIVDGQQRLTSLYAVIRREAGLRENVEREHIRKSRSGRMEAHSPRRNRERPLHQPDCQLRAGEVA